MPQLTDLNDVVLLLEEATQKGSVKWIPEEEDTDSFSARLDAGTVRISQFIVGNTYLLEMLDQQGRLIASKESSPQMTSSTEDRVAHDLLRRLHQCAKNQAIGAENKMSLLLDEIRKRAREGSGV